jgi:hypothetical protein
MLESSASPPHAAAGGPEAGPGAASARTRCRETSKRRGSAPAPCRRACARRAARLRPRAAHRARGGGLWGFAEGCHGSLS